VLDALLVAGIRVAAVVTNPDKRRGRGGKTEASPAKQVAIDHGLEVLESVAEAVEFIERHGTDGVTGVVVAYGRIIREPLLSMIPLVNLHFSLLPRWRGAAPVERAILAGDATTGSSIMQIEAGLDTGGVYDVEEIEIYEKETVEQLRSRLGVIGARQIIRMLRKGFPAPRPQIGEPLHAEKISPDDLLVDWSKPPIDVVRVVRVGGAHTFFRGARVKIHDAFVVDNGEAMRSPDIEVARFEPGTILAVDKTGILVGADLGVVRLTTVQPEGKKAMSAADWANGVRPSVGEIFGSH
jgi:methionyl-tRNA formyltransferase